MSPAEALERLETLLTMAAGRGASAADALAAGGRSVSASVRLGRLEEVQASESVELGLRVFLGQRSASVAGSDLSPGGLATLVDQALGMARHAPQDAHAGLVEPALLARGPFPALDLADQALIELDAERLERRAREAEDAARAVAGVTNSEGGGASAGWGWQALATSHGLRALEEGTRASVSVAVLAGEGKGLERDWASASARHLADLEPAAVVGRRAGERSVRRLGPARLPTGPMPVIFDRRVATSLVGHVLGALSGPAVASGRSFLKDRLGQPLFAGDVHILEDPHRRRGLRSRVHDAEGVMSVAQPLVAEGRPLHWLAERASASRLGVAPSGHAARGLAAPPGVSVSNVWLEPGRAGPADLMHQVKLGFYVTELSGQGVSLLTGDYSRAASGFAIRDGALAEPVAEVTIAGNLAEMFASLVPADDLEWRRGIESPSVRVDTLVVAGA